jgi:hypothetical protein
MNEIELYGRKVPVTIDSRVSRGATDVIVAELAGSIARTTTRAVAAVITNVIIEIGESARTIVVALDGLYYQVGLESRIARMEIAGGRISQAIADAEERPYLDAGVREKLIAEFRLLLDREFERARR